MITLDTQESVVVKYVLSQLDWYPFIPGPKDIERMSPSVHRDPCIHAFHFSSIEVAEGDHELGFKEIDSQLTGSNSQMVFYSWKMER